MIMKRISKIFITITTLVTIVVAIIKFLPKKVMSAWDEMGIGA